MTTAERDAEADAGVEGNRRLTATNAAVLFVLLAVEGVTVLSVRSMLQVHVLVGMMLVPPALLKIGTTTYRAVRYYLGAPTYQHRGPPPPLLRWLGPVVVVTTVGLLATGVVLLLLGPDNRSPWLQLHKASFILWFAAMTVHVLGHIVETVTVAPRDWGGRAPAVAGRGLRRAALVLTVVAGIAAGIALQPAARDWLSSSKDEDAHQVGRHAR